MFHLKKQEHLVISNAALLLIMTKMAVHKNGGMKGCLYFD